MKDRIVTGNGEKGETKRKRDTVPETKSTDMIACEFVVTHHVIATDGKRFYFFDGKCYPELSEDHMRSLVFRITPGYLRDRLSHILSNIASRTYRKPTELLSAYCFDGDESILLNCASRMLRWRKDEKGAWQQEEEFRAAYTPETFYWCSDQLTTSQRLGVPK
jgi:hypothetical protein